MRGLPGVGAITMAGFVSFAFPAAAQLPEPAGGAVGAVCEAVGACSDCRAELAACEAERAACIEGLATCTPGRDACLAEVAACTAERDACVDDLGTCEAERSQAESDLAACETDRDACHAGREQCRTDLGTCGLDLASCEGELAVCEACGNGVVEGDEECDTDDLAGATCDSATGGARHYGEVRCGVACTLDTSECVDCGPVIHILLPNPPSGQIPGGATLYLDADDSHVTRCGVVQDTGRYCVAPCPLGGTPRRLFFAWECTRAPGATPCTLGGDGWDGESWGRQSSSGATNSGAFEALTWQPASGVDYTVRLRVYYLPGQNGFSLFEEKEMQFTTVAP